jgi:hypothetical protein
MIVERCALFFCEDESNVLLEKELNEAYKALDESEK